MKITARCHCGAVELSAELPDGLDPSRCDCSFCVRRQAAAVTAIASSVKVIKGADVLSTYSFGTHMAQHHFCKICGIYTHHHRRSDPTQCGINLGCIDGVHLLDHEPIPWTDGINHPSDR
ncbi:GFA family protein [Ascidiaceihabitans sp.]|uniref:GFA family protein n=1 Tax=Ascidiaceihabitans sp. TaxID=1872644 RepID=UPI003299A174